MASLRVVNENCVPGVRASLDLLDQSVGIVNVMPDMCGATENVSHDLSTVSHPSIVEFFMRLVKSMPFPNEQNSWQGQKGFASLWCVVAAVQTRTRRCSTSG